VKCPPGGEDRAPLRKTADAGGNSRGGEGLALGHKGYIEDEGAARDQGLAIQGVSTTPNRTAVGLTNLRVRLRQAAGGGKQEKEIGDAANAGS